MEKVLRKSISKLCEVVEIFRFIMKATDEAVAVRCILVFASLTNHIHCFLYKR